MRSLVIFLLGTIFLSCKANHRQADLQAVTFEDAEGNVFLVYGEGEDIFIQPCSQNKISLETVTHYVSQEQATANLQKNLAECATGSRRRSVSKESFVDALQAALRLPTTFKNPEIQKAVDNSKGLSKDYYDRLQEKQASLKKKLNVIQHYFSSLAALPTDKEKSEALAQDKDYRELSESLVNVEWLLEDSRSLLRINQLVEKLVAEVVAPGLQKRHSAYAKDDSMFQVLANLYRLSSQYRHRLVKDKFTISSGVTVLPDDTIVVMPSKNINDIVYYDNYPDLRARRKGILNEISGTGNLHLNNTIGSRTFLYGGPESLCCQLYSLDHKTNTLHHHMGKKGSFHDDVDSYDAYAWDDEILFFSDYQRDQEFKLYTKKLTDPASAAPELFLPHELQIGGGFEFMGKKLYTILDNKLTALDLSTRKLAPLHQKLINYPGALTKLNDKELLYLSGTGYRCRQLYKFNLISLTSVQLTFKDETHSHVCIESFAVSPRGSIIFLTNRDQSDENGLWEMWPFAPTPIGKPSGASSVVPEVGFNREGDPGNSRFSI